MKFRKKGNEKTWKEITENRNESRKQEREQETGSRNEREQGKENGENEIRVKIGNIEQGKENR